MNQILKIALGVVVICLGMIGLRNGIEYSGWILFVGCLITVGSL